MRFGGKAWLQRLGEIWLARPAPPRVPWWTTADRAEPTSDDILAPYMVRRSAEIVDLASRRRAKG